MRPSRWLGAALMTLIACAAAPVITAGSPLAAENESPLSSANKTTTTTSTATTAPANALEDRVVLLVADRADPSVWCLGLLIAPRAVLTYAHCVSGTAKPMAWAFFGSTDSAFDQWRAAEANPTQPRDGDVGEMDAWGSIVQTIVHPKYVADGSTPTMDLAVLQLQEPRVTTDAFSLVSNMDEIDAADAFDMEAYTLSNTFVAGARDLKLTPRGTFRKVPWSYCAAQQARTANLGSVWKLFAAPPKGQVCVVASVVEERTSSEFANSFVLLDNKLVGLSIVGTKSSTVAHRFSFLSDQAAFITEATQKTNVWITISNSRLVVGGKDSPALKGYVTGLRLTKSGTNFCLGALIAPKFVLTAAHCVQGFNFSQVSVGSMYAASEVDGEQIKVKRTIVHPNYQAATFKNDYAVVELEYISIQAPILLYNSAGAETAAGTRLKFYGYGPNNGDAPGKLQSVELPVVDKKQCKAVLQPPVLDVSMMCAGGEEGKDACQGDSGGPLVYESKSPVSLVAMASYGRGCAIKGVPAVYAVVSMAGSFINSTVEGHRWLTAYGSDTSVAITTAPSSSSGASATPATVRQQASKPPSAPAPATPSSTPSATRIPSPEARSRDALLPTPTPAPAATPRGSAVLDELETNEGWKPVSTILLKDTSSSGSLTVGDGYSQLTRDIISTTVLSPRSGLAVGASRLQQLTKYKGATSVQFFSDSGLGDIAALISAFDARPLRRRVARFGAAARDNDTCAAHR